MGVVQRRRVRWYGDDAVGRAVHGGSACQGAHGAWRERDGEEGWRMRRPIALHKPRGACGASASVPGPRQRTAWRSTSRGGLERRVPEVFPSGPV
jgi:hypothetical protein